MVKGFCGFHPRLDSRNIRFQSMHTLFKSMCPAISPQLRVVIMAHGVLFGGISSRHSAPV